MRFVLLDLICKSVTLYNLCIINACMKNIEYGIGSYIIIVPAWRVCDSAMGSCYHMHDYSYTAFSCVQP